MFVGVLGVRPLNDFYKISEVMNLLIVSPFYDFEPKILDSSVVQDSPG